MAVIDFSNIDQVIINGTDIETIHLRLGSSGYAGIWHKPTRSGATPMRNVQDEGEGSDNSEEGEK